MVQVDDEEDVVVAVTVEVVTVAVVCGGGGGGGCLGANMEVGCSSAAEERLFRLLLEADGVLGDCGPARLMTPANSVVCADGLAGVEVREEEPASLLLDGRL